MKKILLALLPLALFGSNLSEIASKATQNEISKIKELELKRANLNDEATSSAYLPSLSLEGSYGKNASTFPSIVAKESAGVLARIDFLLYDGGAREARLKMSEGASASAVRISKTFSEFTSCSAFCGEFRLKFIVGSAGSAPKTTQNKTAKLSSAFTTNSSYQGYFS